MLSALLKEKLKEKFIQEIMSAAHSDEQKFINKFDEDIGLAKTENQKDIISKSLSNYRKEIEELELDPFEDKLARTVALHSVLSDIMENRIKKSYSVIKGVGGESDEIELKQIIIDFNNWLVAINEELNKIKINSSVKSKTNNKTTIETFERLNQKWSEVLKGLRMRYDQNSSLMLDVYRLYDEDEQIENIFKELPAKFKILSKLSDEESQDLQRRIPIFMNDLNVYARELEDIHAKMESMDWEIAYQKLFTDIEKNDFKKKLSDHLILDHIEKRRDEQNNFFKTDDLSTTSQKNYFSLKNGISEDELKKLHDKLFLGKFIDDDLDSFIKVFSQETIIKKVNWIDTPRGLFYFLIKMLQEKLEKPETLTQDYEDLDTNQKKRFSEWLNPIVKTRFYLDNKPLRPESSIWKEAKRRQPMQEKRLEIIDEIFSQLL